MSSRNADGLWPKVSIVVYGVRNKRPDDSFFKRNTAGFFYWLSNYFGVPGLAHHGRFSPAKLKGHAGAWRF